MGFFKKQFLSVIEWKDSSNDIIVYRYPLTDRDEIMNSSTLVVRESQVAMFIHKGEIADVFGPGTYKLSTENIPFLTKLLSLSTLGNSRIKSDSRKKLYSTVPRGLTCCAQKKGFSPQYPSPPTLFSSRILALPLCRMRQLSLTRCSMPR